MTDSMKAGKAFDAPQIHFIRKGVKRDTQMVITTENLIQEDEFSGLYFSSKKNTNVVIEPPFNPLVLASLLTRNNILQQCVTAMEVNIDGTGYDFEALTPEEDKVTGDGAIDPVQDSPNSLGTTPSKAIDPNDPPARVSKVTKEAMDPDASGIDKEKEMLEHFFGEPFPGESFTTIRRKLRVDLEATGNGYLEAIRNLAGELVFVRHLESVFLRLVKLDAPVDVETTVTRGGKDVTAIIPMRERRFCYKVGANLVFYREFGTSRQINKKTGAWIDNGDKNVDTSLLGSEIIPFRVNKDFRTHYGLPRWINQLPSVLGSRKAEEYNLEFFDSGGMPPAIIFVQGGALVGGVREQLQNYLSGKASQKHRAAIVEVMSTSGSLDNAGSVQVKTERFGACQDAETEILTEKGWVKFPEWNGEKVGTIEKGNLVYHLPTQYHVYDHDGDLIHIEGAATEFMVTPKHRVWYIDRGGSFRFMVAPKVLKKSEVKIPVAPEYGYLTEEVPVFEVGGTPYLADTFLDFLGMFIADGSTNSHIKVGSCGIFINVKKQRKVDFISSFFPAVAQQSGVVLHKTKDIRGYTKFSIYDRSLRDWLQEKVGTYASNKRIPPVFLKLNQKQSQRLLYALLQGDGHRNDEANKNGWTYTTVSPQLANDVQVLCLHAGYRSVLSNVKAREEYCVSITPKTFAVVTKGRCPTWETTHYTGKVYCFTMPTGVFVSRRKGKVCITGNSTTDFMFQKYDDQTKEHIRTSFRLAPIFIGSAEAYNYASALASLKACESQVFQPERFEFDERVNTTIMKALGAKKYRFRSKGTTFADSTAQIQGMLYASKVLGGKEVIETLNEITGLTMEYDESKDPAQQQPQGSMGGDPSQGGQGSPFGGQPKDPNTQSQGDVSPQDSSYAQQPPMGTNDLGQPPPTSANAKY